MENTEEIKTVRQSIFTKKELYGLGFNLESEEFDDDNFGYKFWTLFIDSLQIGYTIEYDKNNIITNDFFEISEVVFEDISKEDFIKLLEILRNGKSRN